MDSVGIVGVVSIGAQMVFGEVPERESWSELGYCLRGSTGGVPFVSCQGVIESGMLIYKFEWAKG